MCIRDSAWTEPFRFYRLGTPQLQFSAEGASGLRLRTDRPVKGLWLAHEGQALADNFIDLVPGPGCLVDLRIALPAGIQACALDVAPLHVSILRTEGRCP